ncbi:MAG: FtsQ-type POTRA domain-containing protein [Deltaproteobacteria bacterium]
MKSSTINSDLPRLRYRKQRQHKKIVRFFVLLISVLALSFLSYKTLRFLIPLIGSLQIFQYKNAIVSPTEHISEEELKKLMGKLSGNLFHLDLDAIQASIKKNPWVLEAKVSRIFPDRIRVDITEKKAAALLSMDRDGLYFLDPSGKKIAPLRPSDHSGFPVISGLNPVEVEKGDLILKAYELIQLYESKSFLKNLSISEVAYKEGIGYMVFTRHPVFEIRLGQDYWDEKFYRLEKVLQDLSQKLLVPQFIDLNFSKKVVVKLSK